jgi:hypothetical protein
MIHPYGPYWIPFAITVAMGAPFGLAGGLLARKMFRRKPSATAGLLDMLIGGAWWSASAIFLPWDFPFMLLRSLVGAFLVAALYESILAVLVETISN